MGRGTDAGTAVEELRADRRIPSALVEALADHVHAVRLGTGPEGLAAGQGIAVEVHELAPWMGGALTRDGVIVVKPRRDLAVLRLAVLHEFAHHVLRAYDHTHGDVWALALAMGAPRATVARCQNAGDLAAATGLPWWAADARLVSAQASRTGTAG